MLYGPYAPRRLPRQNADLILLMADRFERCSSAMEPWAKQAKECVEFFEGKQWSQADLDFLAKQKRPPLTINKLAPLVKLVIGYHLNNRVDWRALPGTDGTGTATVADAINQVFKQISQDSHLPYVDAEVFLDGLLTGRGFYDTRLSFENNDFGEIKVRAQDNFATYLPPEAETYDPIEWPYVITSRMISIDEVDVTYGLDALNLVEPLVRGGGTFTGIPNSYFADSREEITPWRRFGGESEGEAQFWQGIQERFYDMIDYSRKTIRLIDMQHYIRVRRNYFIDLETGDKQVIPEDWTPQKVQLTQQWAKEQGAPLAVQSRVEKRIAWTHMVGDIIVYNEWSPYQRYTITPFFPYFRRGQTRGMVHDLLDPQREVNKRRSSRLNIIMRAGNSGWQYAKGSLDPWNKDNLERNGSTAGFHLEWDSMGGKLPEPKQIAPPTPPEAMRQLEQEAEDDLKAISGVNDSALGTLDKVQSGRAIEAKQRQTVVGLEQFMSNYSRSKQLLGENVLNQVQKHYTERRIVRIIADNGQANLTVINDRVGAAGAIINNVTLGKYSITIDETPLSASFLEGQFEELLRMKEMGIPIPEDFIVDASSIGRKDELKEQLKEAQQAPPPPPPEANPAVLQNKMDTAVAVARINAAAEIEAAQMKAGTDNAQIRANVEMHELEIASGVGAGAPVQPAPAAPGGGAPGPQGPTPAGPTAPAAPAAPGPGAAPPPGPAPGAPPPPGGPLGAPGAPPH